MRVLPETDYGETDQPVVVTTRHSRSRGVGMRAWLDEGTTRAALPGADGFRSRCASSLIRDLPAAGSAGGLVWGLDLSALVAAQAAALSSDRDSTCDA